MPQGDRNKNKQSSVMCTKMAIKVTKGQVSVGNISIHVMRSAIYVESFTAL